jgi:hypothetical protein
MNLFAELVADGLTAAINLCVLGLENSTEQAIV